MAKYSKCVAKAVKQAQIVHELCMQLEATGLSRTQKQIVHAVDRAAFIVFTELGEEYRADKNRSDLK